MKKNKYKIQKKAERRRLELARRKKIARIRIFVSMLLIGIICFAVYFTVLSNGDGQNTDVKKPEEQPQQPPSQTGTEIKIPISEIGTNAKFYAYDANGVTVKYFTVKGSDGEIHVAFDACDVCYKAKKGYTQKSDVMSCINCGKEYEINGIGTDNTQGGCWPSYLPMNIDGDDVVIKKSDLEAKSWMFW